MIRESVWVLRSRPGRHGGPGEKLPDREVEGCRLWPRMAGNEAGGDADGVPLDGWNVMAPDGVDIAAGDRLLVRGKEHRVDGVPAVYLGKGVLVVTIRVGT